LCNIAEADLPPPEGLLHPSTDSQGLEDEINRYLVDQRAGPSPLCQDFSHDLSDSIRLENEREYPRDPPPTYEEAIRASQLQDIEPQPGNHN